MLTRDLSHAHDSSLVPTQEVDLIFLTISDDSSHVIDLPGLSVNISGLVGVFTAPTNAMVLGETVTIAATMINPLDGSTVNATSTARVVQPYTGKMYLTAETPGQSGVFVMVPNTTRFQLKAGTSITLTGNSSGATANVVSVVPFFPLILRMRATGNFQEGRDAAIQANDNWLDSGQLFTSPCSGATQWNFSRQQNGGSTINVYIECFGSAD